MKDKRADSPRRHCNPKCTQQTIDPQNMYNKNKTERRNRESHNWN